MSDLLLSSYDYALPPELIAKYPAEPADSARLFVYKKESGEIIHSVFSELASFLPDCAIIFNDTKVFKARFFGNKESGAKCELFINKILPNDEFLVQIRGKVRQNDKLLFKNNLSAQVLALNSDGTRLVRFFDDGALISTQKLLKISENIGHVPLPPYLKREDTSEDELSYQSIFAKNIGAVAAPTASLHFTPRVMASLKKHEQAFVTLHVGAGTFASVECEHINEHKMHSEYYEISPAARELIDSKKPLLGVGTTATRCIEYYARTKKTAGECDLFLNPFNKPIRQDFLLTNFHLPKSTLIMLVASFIGREKTLELYSEAISKQYKFYSYGDAMLII